MRDVIARALSWVLSLLTPCRPGRHSAEFLAAQTPEPEPAPTARPRRLLPLHKSPYAREAAERRPFVDTINPVRPYITASPRRRPDDPECRAQAERRWALDMALRGIDVGPSMIHGVDLRTGARTVRVAVGA